MKNVFWFFEDIRWSINCSYNLWLHGPYGLAKVIEQIPFRFLVKYLRKYGATIGTDCRFERGLNLHRPMGKKPFENLKIGNGVYLGHNTLIDLTKRVTIKDHVIIASRCQIWTHASFYNNETSDKIVYGEKAGDVEIEEYAIIYSSAIILAGVIIGKLAKIGASSLVNKSVAPNIFVAGSPATEKR